jgi:hypothetical protein
VGWQGASLDGDYFYVAGQATQPDPDGRGRWSIKVFNGLTGEVQWSKRLKDEQGDLFFSTTDPRGQLLAISTSAHEDQGGTLVEMSSGKVLGSLQHCPRGCLSPNATYLVLSGPADPSGVKRGYSLFRQGDKTPLVVLGIDTEPSFNPTFNLAGTLLAWGNSDGTVTVCNIEQIRARLAQIGLDW